jgi:lipocalin
MINKIIFFTGLLIISYFLCGFFWAENKFVKNLPIQNVNLEKYLGTWYEIARYPVWFEKDLVGVTATYSLKKDNHIEVLNQGFQKTLDGVNKKAIGDAWLADKTKTGSLRVSFFWPFSAGYHVVALGENYDYALVLSDSTNYMWILSRKPTLDEKIYNDLLALAKNLGIDISKVEKVTQKTE